METKDLKQLENEYDVDKSKFYGKISSRIKNKSVGKNVLEVEGKLIANEDELLTVVCTVSFRRVFITYKKINNALRQLNGD